MISLASDIHCLEINSAMISISLLGIYYYVQVEKVVGFFAGNTGRNVLQMLQSINLTDEGLNISTEDFNFYHNKIATCR